MLSENTESVRLCVQTHHPIDPGNYPGPIHCTACPPGTACVTAMYERVPETTYTADERFIENGAMLPVEDYEPRDD